MIIDGFFFRQEQKFQLFPVSSAVFMVSFHLLVSLEAFFNLNSKIKESLNSYRKIVGI